MSELTIDRVVSGYVKLRDDLRARESAFKDSVAADKAKLLKLENFLLGKAKEMGVDSFKTGSGTAYRTTTERVSVADWDAFSAFAEENELQHMYTHNVKKTEIISYMKENDGELPPGLDYSCSYGINVNRPRGKTTK